MSALRVTHLKFVSSYIDAFHTWFMPQHEKVLWSKVQCYTASFNVFFQSLACLMSIKVNLQSYHVGKVSNLTALSVEDSGVWLFLD